jgi:hypothetical protein
VFLRSQKEGTDTDKEKATGWMKISSSSVKGHRYNEVEICAVIHSWIHSLARPTKKPRVAYALREVHLSAQTQNGLRDM